MRGHDETVQLNKDCNGYHNDDLECDESLFDVLLKPMRSMDDMICLVSFFIEVFDGTSCDDNNQYEEDTLKEHNGKSR